MTLETKRCPRCEETKHTSEFHKDRYRDDGFCTYCKPCKKAIDAERLADPQVLQKRIEQRKSWLKNNRERHNATVLARYHRRKAAQSQEPTS